jgi:hypothetical protein
VSALLVFGILAAWLLLDIPLAIIAGRCLEGRA